MKNNLENRFKSKFDILNSQENSELIVWSSDSDHEASFNNENVKTSKQNICYKKRKRGNNKISKNTTHLNITFTETEQKNNKSLELSPVCSRNKSPRLSYPSPILTNSQRHFLPLNINNLNKSPIILSKTKSYNHKEKSYKHIPPINSSKVRKTLFNCSDLGEKAICRQRSPSPILKLTQKSISMTNKDLKHTDRTHSDNKLNNLHNINDSLPKLKSNLLLIDKVKSYFDNHFSSNTSQSPSISECDTENDKNSSKSNEDIEIVNSQPENLESIAKLERNNSMSSLSSYDNDLAQKKIKYKKDGLAFRLNVLKKKQNANATLWLHERFLAANSSFILPSESYLVFRIQNVTIKYGCHLIDVFDMNNDKYLVIINNLYVYNNNMDNGAVLKVYKPYNVLECTDYKLIVNLCKYECVVLKNNK